jgi:hypothetical protein
MPMTRALALCLTLQLISASSFAAPTDPASDASIEEYLKVSNAEQLIATMKQQMGGFIKNAMQQAVQGKALTPERQAIIDHMAQQMSDLMSDTLSWDTLKPLYMRVYHESFTQAEIEGIIHFYKTPAGKALINKMPVVMQNVMGEMQGLIKPMQQKMLQIQREAAEKIKATPDQ